MKEAPKLRIIDPDKRVGGTVGMRGSLYETLDSNRKMLAMQIMASRRYDAPKYSERDLAMTKKLVDDHDLFFCIHAPYMVNLGNPKLGSVSTACLSGLFAAYQPLSPPIVFHVGSNPDREEGIRNIAANVQRVNRRGGLLLLENSAGQGNSIGRNVEEFRHIFENIDESKGVGICLDTQHAFASGMCDFSSHESVVRCYDDLTSIAPIGLIHLNDSVTPCCGCKDRHESICQGRIWERDDETLQSVLDVSMDRKIPVILETCTVTEDFKLLQDQYMRLEHV